MVDIALFTSIVSANLVIWTSVTLDLLAEHRIHHPMPGRRRQRQARRTAAAMWAHTGPNPDLAVPGISSTGRQALPSDARRVMPAAGTLRRIPVPAAGPHVHHGRPACG